MNPPAASWEARLAAARRMLADGPQEPTWVTDQLDAAAGDAKAAVDRHAAAMGWPQAGQDIDPDPDQRTLLAAGLLAVDKYCSHLRRQWAQPTIFRLAARRADCQKCVTTARTPVIAADECALCGTTGVTAFTPITLQTGPGVVIADICDACTTGLGIEPNPADDDPEPPAAA